MTLTVPPLLAIIVVLIVTPVIWERVVTKTLRAVPVAWVAFCRDLAKTRYLVPGLKFLNVLPVCQPSLGTAVPVPWTIAYSTR